MSVFLISLLVFAYLSPFSTAHSSHDELPSYQRLKRQTTTCKSSEYGCAQGGCIASSKACDGSADCADSSDETEAACKAVHNRCPSFSFQCDYGACLQQSVKCDGRRDCLDGSDESNCSDSVKSQACGLAKKPAASSGLRSSGIPSQPSEFPWNAAIYKKDKSGKWEMICSGTLITSNIVMTAAHCLTDFDGKTNPQSEFKVGLGKYYEDFYRNEENSVISDVKEIKIPRLYNGVTTNYALDISLLALADSVPVTANIMPACVDWTSSFTVSNGELGSVAGWGLRTRSDTLLSAQLSYSDTLHCRDKLNKKEISKIIAHDKFCAFEPTKGSYVDTLRSGAGLTVAHNDKHYVIGLASSKLTNGEEPVFLFTDLANQEHRTWIASQRAQIDKEHH